MKQLNQAVTFGEFTRKIINISHFEINNNFAASQSSELAAIQLED